MIPQKGMPNDSKAMLPHLSQDVLAKCIACWMLRLALLRSFPLDSKEAPRPSSDTVAAGAQWEFSSLRAWDNEDVFAIQDRRHYIGPQLTKADVSLAIVANPT